MSAVRGLVVDRYKSWRDVGIGTLPRPDVGPSDVLIAPEAGALNFPDLLLIEGKYQQRPDLPFFLGRDIVGRIVEVGAAVREFSPGERVAAQPYWGGFADLALSPASQCFRLPESLDAKIAACLGTAFATVIVALELRGGVQPGETVLITGAAGGVGAAGIQYAKHLGAHVVALVSSEEKELSAIRNGADSVLRSDRMSDLRSDIRPFLERLGVPGVDVVMDVVGGEAFEGSVRCLKHGGRMVVVGFASGSIPKIAVNYLLLKDISVVGSSIQRFLSNRDMRLLRGMETVYARAAQGDFRLEIDSVHLFSDFPKAAERLASRSAIGKIVLVPDWA